MSPAFWFATGVASWAFLLIPVHFLFTSAPRRRAAKQAVLRARIKRYVKQYPWG